MSISSNFSLSWTNQDLAIFNEDEQDIEAFSSMDWEVLNKALYFEGDSSAEHIPIFNTSEEDSSSISMVCGKRTRNSSVDAAVHKQRKTSYRPKKQKSIEDFDNKVGTFAKLLFQQYNSKIKAQSIIDAIISLYNNKNTRIAAIDRLATVLKNPVPFSKLFMHFSSVYTFFNRFSPNIVNELANNDEKSQKMLGILINFKVLSEKFYKQKHATQESIINWMVALKEVADKADKKKNYIFRDQRFNRPCYKTLRVFMTYFMHDYSSEKAPTSSQTQELIMIIKNHKDQPIPKFDLQSY